MNEQRERLRSAISEHSVIDQDAHLACVFGVVKHKSGADGTMGQLEFDLTPVELPEAEQSVKRASASTRRAAKPPRTIWENES